MISQVIQGHGKIHILNNTAFALPELGRGKIQDGLDSGIHQQIGYLLSPCGRSRNQTDLDAQRIKESGAPVVQINTEGACHLSAIQISDALKKLPVKDLDLIIIENVGNLVCPSAFELGENGKIVVLSVAEGDDKPAKYPTIFAKSKVLLINKIDMLAGGLVDFDIEKAKSDARKLNKAIEIFPISAKTGEGMADWYDWLRDSNKTLLLSP